jgi:hypothetical protein
MKIRGFFRKIKNIPFMLSSRRKAACRSTTDGYRSAPGNLLTLTRS